MPDVDPTPQGYPRLSPYLCVAGADEAIAFYTRVFGAVERLRLPGPGGRVGHAELAIGDALVMLSDEFPDMGVAAPSTVGGTPVTLSLYVADVDATFDEAVRAGATPLRPVEDQFYGDRSGQFLDPFGHRWSVATHVEDVPPDEMATRSAKMLAGD
jgi:PhnB protein